MPAGIRVTVEFPEPDCPVAAVTGRSPAVVEGVATSATLSAANPPVTEFLLAAGDVPEDFDPDPVFTYADHHVYRVTHDGDCPCTRLGEHDTPIDRYYAADGALTVDFHVPTFDRVQAVVGDLRERFPDVDIRRLVRAPTDRTPADTVFVDRGRLTDRQLEVLLTAYEMGYFEQPRAANATAVAEALDIAPSTLTEHLLTAQRKLLEDVLADRT